MLSYEDMKKVGIVLTGTTQVRTRRNSPSATVYLTDVDTDGEEGYFIILNIF